MEHLSTDMEQQNQQVQWRRDKVQELCSKGYSQQEVVGILYAPYFKALIIWP
jgi:hypothetical protein